MNRLALAGTTALVIGGLFGGALVAHAQSSGGSGDSNQAQGDHGPGGKEHGRRGPGPFRGPGPGFLPGIPGGHSFDQLLGSETRYKDADGKVHTLIAYPGVVTKIEGSNLTIKLNDGSGDKTFQVPESLANTLSRVKADDKVIVTVDGEVKAILRVPAPRPPLTDEQRQKLKDAQEKLKQERKELREQRKNRQTPTPTPSTSNTTNA